MRELKRPDRNTRRGHGGQEGVDKRQAPRCKRLNTMEGEGAAIIGLARGRNQKDLQLVRVVQDRDGNVVWKRC